MVKGGKILSTGFNQIRSIELGPKFGYFEGSLHSEVDCLLGIDRSVSTGSDMYVFRSYKNGDLASAKPCEQCIGFMSGMGIRRVFFSVTGGFEMIKIN